MSNYATAIYFGQRLLDLHGAYCAGPLFHEYGKCRTPILNTSRQHGARRRARERQATPPWARSGEVSAEIREIYRMCESLNRCAGCVKYHVDHIVPLDGKLVCGLHVPWNLRILRKEANLAKGRLTWPDMPMEQLELL